jgi:glycerophosphoryl diester phosphodiesterase
MSYTLYAHRGNLFGPKPELENTPDYIDQAIKFGFKVEVDVWLNSDNNLYLGHDKPETLVSFEYLFIRHDSLLIHAKNIEALIYLSSRTRLNVFYHTNEHAVLSSNGNLIFHPDNYPDVTTPIDSIYSMPELSNKKIYPYKNLITDYAGTLHAFYDTRDEDDKRLLPEILRYT